jgi:hypothetical protein
VGVGDEDGCVEICVGEMRITVLLEDMRNNVHEFTYQLLVLVIVLRVRPGRKKGTCIYSMQTGIMPCATFKTVSLQ